MIRTDITCLIKKDIGIIGFFILDESDIVPIPFLYMIDKDGNINYKGAARRA